MCNNVCNNLLAARLPSGQPPVEFMVPSVSSLRLPSVFLLSLMLHAVAHFFQHPDVCQVLPTQLTWTKPSHMLSMTRCLWLRQDPNEPESVHHKYPPFSNFLSRIVCIHVMYSLLAEELVLKPYLALLVSGSDPLYPHSTPTLNVHFLGPFPVPPIKFRYNRTFATLEFLKRNIVFIHKESLLNFRLM